MADILRLPRKRRTRNHVIADQSMNFVERFIYVAGFTAERVVSDYGFDLTMNTFDADGFVEPGRVVFQMKASDRWAESRAGDSLLVPIDVADYNLWVREPFPVFLVLYDAPARRAYWLYVQHYFEHNPSRRPRPSAATVRMFVPKSNKIGVRFVAYARRCKETVLGQSRTLVHHE